MKAARLQDSLLVLVAAWLLAFALLGGFTPSQPAGWFALALGSLLLVSAAKAPRLPRLIEEWIDLAIGVALLVTPWITGFEDDGPVARQFTLSGALVSALAFAGLARDLHPDRERARRSP